MDQPMPLVKPQVNQRRQQAKATRRRIIDAARQLFADAGYAATTMEAVAAAAGVAVQTVYHVFHTKPELLKAVILVASAGQHDPPPETELAWLEEIQRASDGRRILAVSIEYGVDSSARVARLIGAINAATSADPDFASFWDASCDARRQGTAQIVAVLAAKGLLRPELDVQRAADILYSTTSHESILAFDRDCGWSLEAIKAWYYGMLCHELLPDEAGSATSVGSAPTGGLSFDALVSG
jgi:AcrR family transcriptional regulator